MPAQTAPGHWTGDLDERMSCDHSPYSTAWAERFARENYALDAHTTQLAGEFDLNFHLQTDGGESYVLKVSPVGADFVALECQIEALKHLANTPLAALFQRVCPTADGQNLLRLADEQGFRWVRLVSYLEGTPLAHHHDRPASFLEEIGRTLANLDLALANFDHPGAKRDLHWDISRTAELGRFSQYVPDQYRRKMVEGHLDHFEKRVAPRLVGLAHSVIYNDANDHNILVRTEPDGTPRLAGLVDFGDMLHTVTAAEPAIACAYLMLDRDDPIATAVSLISGYHDVRPLTPTEHAVVFDLIIARLCGSVLMSARGRHEDPENEYLQISEAPVWRLLERLSIIDRNDIESAIGDACRREQR